jgi:hypothetical protein
MLVPHLPIVNAVGLVHGYFAMTPAVGNTLLSNMIRYEDSEDVAPIPRYAEFLVSTLVTSTNHSSIAAMAAIGETSFDGMRVSTRHGRNESTD